MNKLELVLSTALVLTPLGCKSGGPTQPTEPVTEPAASTEGTTAQQTAAPAEADALRTAIESPERPEAERARDQYRHPHETLTFFGVEPDDEVLELWAGGGWYTHILAPYLAERGKLHVTSFSQDHEREYLRNLRAKIDDYVETSGHPVSIIAADTENLDFGLDEQVDVVLTFRNVHNWVKGDYDRQVYEQAYQALKPGGIFGVVEHRGPEGMTREESAETGYMDQATVIADVEAVGFELVETSEINANPKDTADHPEGVWTLPPSLRLGDEDREKYTSIGESDRMTLKFRKPE